MKNEIIFLERVTMNTLRNPMDIISLAHIDYPISELNILKYLCVQLSNKAIFK